MISNPIPLSGPEASRQLNEACRKLDRGSKRSPLDFLRWLTLRTEDPSFLYNPNFLRIQDYLRRFVNRDQLDSSWIRGAQAEAFFSGIMGGRLAGGRETKYDLISKRNEAISVKVYSGREFRIQSGNIGEFDDRTTLVSFMRRWIEPFIDRNLDPEDPEIIYLKNHSLERMVCSTSIHPHPYPMIDLVAMRNQFPGNPNWEERYQVHLRYRKAWRAILQKNYQKIKYWLLLYISTPTPSLDGYLQIDWFHNRDVIDHLSPQDRPAPIFLRKKVPGSFRFSVEGLKESVPRVADRYRSGTFYYSRLLRAEAPRIRRILQRRTQIYDLVEQLEEASLDQVVRLLWDLKVLGRKKKNHKPQGLKSF